MSPFIPCIGDGKMTCQECLRAWWQEVTLYNFSIWHFERKAKTKTWIWWKGYTSTSYLLTGKRQKCAILLSSAQCSECRQERKVRSMLPSRSSYNAPCTYIPSTPGPRQWLVESAGRCHPVRRARFDPSSRGRFGKRLVGLHWWHEQPKTGHDDNLKRQSRWWTLNLVSIHKFSILNPLWKYAVSEM